jgi:hypothetical protein
MSLIQDVKRDDLKPYNTILTMNIASLMAGLMHCI